MTGALIEATLELGHSRYGCEGADADDTRRSGIDGIELIDEASPGVIDFCVKCGTWSTTMPTANAAPAE